MMELRLPELVRIGDWRMTWRMVTHPGEQRLFVHGAGGHNLSTGHLLHGSNSLLLLLIVKVALMVTRHLQLGLHLPQLPPGQHLDVTGDLLPGPGLARPQLDVPRYQLIPTVHLALVTQDDLSSSTRRIDGQGFLEALFNLRSPDTLSISSCCLLVIIKLAGVILGDLLVDSFTDTSQSDSV